MRRYSYVWKSSDGARHVDEMRARSKDEVFSALRKQGIRPVRVEAQPMPWWWWLFALAAVSLVLVSFVYFHNAKSYAERAKVAEFSKAGAAIISQYREQISAIRFLDGSDLGKAHEQITKASRIIDVTRSRLRLAYRDSGGKGLPECDRLYGRFTATLDADIERLDALIETMGNE